MIELTIIHDGVNWIARNDVLYAEAASLAKLDCELKELLKKKIKSDPEEVEWEYQLATVYFSQGNTRKAIRGLEKIEKERGFMAFDNATLPVWMRQHAQHYFNRIVRVEN